jgi:uncharacterized protein (DUF433 family)
MTDLLEKSPTVVRTDRGLTVEGTRLTLYSIMECLWGGWTEDEVRDHYELTEQQMHDILTYVEEHRAAFQAEYEQVLQDAEETRGYWEERNRERFAEIATKAHPPEQAALWAKLAAERARHDRS